MIPNSASKLRERTRLLTSNPLAWLLALGLTGTACESDPSPPLPPDSLDAGAGTDIVSWSDTGGSAGDADAADVGQVGRDATSGDAESSDGAVADAEMPDSGLDDAGLADADPADTGTDLGTADLGADTGGGASDGGSGTDVGLGPDAGAGRDGGSSGDLGAFDSGTPVDGGPSRATLEVRILGSGQGDVSSSPSGITCGTDCVETFSGGTSVTLMATAAPGSSFDGWGGRCVGGGASCTVGMDADHTVTARFLPSLACTEGQRTDLLYDAHAYCTLEGAQAGNDTDQFQLMATAGETIRIIAKGTSGSVSPRVEIRSPDGTRLHDGACFPRCEPSTFNLSASPTLPQTGAYTLTISDIGFNNWGNYEVYVGCVDGPCFEAHPIPQDSSTYASFSAYGIDLDYFEIDAQANTELRFIAKGTSGSVSPRLEIRDPSGALVHAGNCFPGCETRTFNLRATNRVPMSGTYRIVVDESGQNNWGNYEIHHACLQGSCFDSLKLSHDASHYDAISAYGIDLDHYRFDGTAGDVIRLVAKGTSGSVSPRVELRDPNGTLLHRGACFPWCEPATLNLSPSTTLPLSGVYTFSISESGQNNWGNYEIHLGCPSGSCFSGTRLSYGATAASSIDAYGIDMDYFVFDGAAGTEIRVLARGTSGSVSPRVEIWDPNGGLLHAGGCGAGCETSTFNVSPSPTLPLSGTYTVLVSESGQNNWGNYRLSLFCLFGACP